MTSFNHVKNDKSLEQITSSIMASTVTGRNEAKLEDHLPDLKYPSAISGNLQVEVTQKLSNKRLTDALRNLQETPYTSQGRMSARIYPNS